jgi:hypothetical protein
VSACALWLLGAWVVDRVKAPAPKVRAFTNLKESH